MAKKTRRRFSVLPFLIMISLVMLLVLSTAAACRVGLIQVHGSLTDIFGTAIRDKDFSVISSSIFPLSTEHPHFSSYLQNWLLLTLQYLLWYIGILSAGVLPVLIFTGHFRKTAVAEKPKALLGLGTDEPGQEAEAEQQKKTLSIADSLSKAVDYTRYGTHDPFPAQAAVIVRLTLNGREYYVTDTMPGDDAIYSLAKENTLIALDGTGEYQYLSFYRYRLRIQYSADAGCFTVRTKGQFLREEPDDAAVLDAVTIRPGEEKQVCVEDTVLHILITV